MNIQKTKYITTMMVLSVFGSTATITMQEPTAMEETSQEAVIASPTLTRVISQNRDIFMALTGLAAEDEQEIEGEDRQYLVQEAVGYWETLIRDFTVKTIEPTVEIITQLDYLRPKFETGFAFPVTEKSLEALAYLQENKGGGLTEEKEKPTKEEILVAQCLLGRGALNFTDADLQAKIEAMREKGFEDYALIYLRLK